MKIKNQLSQFKFFFRRVISFKDLSFTEKRRLLFMCDMNKEKAKAARFKRTFNNSWFNGKFEWIGFYPVFTDKFLFLSFFSAEGIVD